MIAAVIGALALAGIYHEGKEINGIGKISSQLGKKANKLTQLYLNSVGEALDHGSMDVIMRNIRLAEKFEHGLVTSYENKLFSFLDQFRAIKTNDNEMVDPTRFKKSLRTGLKYVIGNGPKKFEAEATQLLNSL